MAFLELKNINKHFGSTHVLRDINLRIENLAVEIWNRLEKRMGPEWLGEESESFVSHLRLKSISFESPRNVQHAERRIGAG